MEALQGERAWFESHPLVARHHDPDFGSLRFQSW